MHLPSLHLAVTQKSSGVFPMRHSILVTFLITLSVGSASADIFVSGLIDSQTWSRADSPVHITDTLIIEQNTELLIEGGVDVLVDSGVPILVYGALRANGSGLDSVRFLPAERWDGSPLRMNGWGGVHVLGNGSAWFNSTTLSGAHRRESSPGAAAITKLDSAGSLQLMDCTVSHNGSAYAGGIYARNASIYNSTFEHNIGAEAGAIMGTNLRIGGCIIMNNSGLGSAFAGNGWISGSWIRNNVGPVIMAYGKTVTIDWTAILNNNGPIRAESRGDIVVDRCTMTGPALSGNGNRFFELSGEGTSLSISNSILWDSAMAMVVTYDRGATADSIDVSYSIVQTPVTPQGVGNSTVTPLFINAVSGDIRLQAGSPAIDGGNPELLDPSGSRADIGAVPLGEQLPADLNHPLPHVDTPLGVASGTPTGFVLLQNAPNPFNPSTTIRFKLPSERKIRLSVYDVTGRLVRSLVDGHRDAGQHEVLWDGLDFSGRAVGSGVYMYRLTGGSDTLVRRMLLVK
jgi:hypothetical protein